MIGKTSVDIADSTLSVIISDPLMGTSAIHGVTNKRPKAYSGEHIECPWDKEVDAILKIGDSQVVINDFPALNTHILKASARENDSLFHIRPAVGECLVILYSSSHAGHWLTLQPENHIDIIDLWIKSSLRGKQMKDCLFAFIFENDGPLNTMPHPHGQQYNFGEIPPFIQSEIERCEDYYAKKRKNLMQVLYEEEMKSTNRIVAQNDSFIAFVPQGAKWPYQIRILPRRHMIYLHDMVQQERQDLSVILTRVRQAYNGLFKYEYKPTIMMDVLQAPFIEEEKMRAMYGLRVEFFVSALSPKAEKLMFSVENATGFSVYSQRAEEAAFQLTQSLADQHMSIINNKTT